MKTYSTNKKEDICRAVGRGRSSHKLVGILWQYTQVTKQIFLNNQIEIEVYNIFTKQELKEQLVFSNNKKKPNHIYKHKQADKLTYTNLGTNCI